MDEVAVVGGGLAGLVAARHLAERDLQVSLFESRDRLGGRVSTERAGGFTMDRGFQVLFPAYPAVRRELDLDALRLRRFRPGAVLARPGRRSILADPLRDLRALTPTLFNREVTLGDGVRILRLKRELAGTATGDILERDGRSIAEALAARGFSDRFRESFATPFLGGLTLDRSLSSAEFVFEYAFKMLAEKSAALPAEGMVAIADQLAARARAAGVQIELSAPVRALDADGAEATVSGEWGSRRADGVVVATDPATARELTGIAAIPTETRGCVTQYFSLPTGQQLDLGRRLVLNAADGRPNHVALVSEVADEYAPAGRHLLSATFLEAGPATDEELAAEVRAALESWFPANSFADLVQLETYRIADGQLVQPPGFRRGLPAPDAPAGPVVLAGEYTRWSSIQGALESGARAARALTDAG